MRTNKECWFRKNAFDAFLRGFKVLSQAILFVVVAVALNFGRSLEPRKSKLRIVALMFVFSLALSLFVSAGNVIVKNGMLNVSNDFITNTSTLFVDSDNQRVGIGTTSPDALLDIKSGSGGRVSLDDNSANGQWSLDSGALGAWFAIRNWDRGTDDLVILNSSTIYCLTDFTLNNIVKKISMINTNNQLFVFFIILILNKINKINKNKY